ncbi:hypothetical protein F5Y09DRAFT_60655 [Xylaria sp. FL1042]|nr:hypothetical protein F5Y09DRAFT_60655 [Xylaria sp. FL1042]
MAWTYVSATSTRPPFVFSFLFSSLTCVRQSTCQRFSMIHLPETKDLKGYNSLRPPITLEIRNRILFLSLDGIRRWNL